METYIQLAHELGLERAVFVQAKPFATDNACLLDAIQKFGPQRARGIAVVTDQVSDKELAAMNLENDLAAAKEASYSLFAAQRTLNDAKDDYHDTAKSHDYNADHYEVISAKHSLEAAKYTYNATVQSFESSFRILFNKVKDDKQVLDAAKTALSVQKDTYASMELKYKQGTLSENKLADAKDAVTAAQEAITTAQTNLFSDYNTYRWAVDHGILN